MEFTTDEFVALILESFIDSKLKIKIQRKITKLNKKINQSSNWHAYLWWKSLVYKFKVNISWS